MHFHFISDYKESPTPVPLANGMYGKVKIASLWSARSNKSLVFFTFTESSANNKLVLTVLPKMKQFCQESLRGRYWDLSFFYLHK